MKFGKYIQNHQLTEWSDHYMNYKALKKIINSLSTGPTSQRFPSIKTAFFYQLERELERVNEFYLQKESDLKLRLRSLLEKKKLLCQQSCDGVYRTSYLALREAFSQFQLDLDKLQQFVEINGTGFRKILKKWDKRSKSSTKELYLARQVEVQPCFNQEVIADLSDTASTQLVDLLDRIETLAGVESPAFPFNRDLATNAAGGRPVAVGSTAALDDLEANLFEALKHDRDGLVREVVQSHGGSESGSVVLTVPSSATNLGDVMRIFSNLFWRACSEGIWNRSVKTLAASGLVDFAYADDINDRTCLHEAAVHGLMPVLQFLTDRGRLADLLDRPDYYGRTALHYASMHGHADLVVHLLTHDPPSNVALTDHDGYGPLTYAVVRGSHPCARVVLDYLPNPLGTAAQRSLLLACHYGRLDMVKWMLDRGADLAPDPNGTHPLHITARQGHPALCRLLIAYGADVNAVDKDSTWRPVFFAAHEGHIACVRVLLDAGCKLDVYDESSRTPVYYAAINGYTEVAVLLHAAGCPVEERSDDATVAVVGDPGATSTSPALVPEPPGGVGGDVAQGSSPFGATHSHHLTNNPMSMNDLDLDRIPSLSLPPPIIPVRTYGHKYLDRKYHLQIAFGHPSQNPDRPPVRLRGYNTQVSTLRLEVAPKPGSGIIPQTLLLPLEEEQRVVSFQLPIYAPFSVEFSIFPSFGSKLMGKAVALAPAFGFTEVVTPVTADTDRDAPWRDDTLPLPALSSSQVTGMGDGVGGGLSALSGTTTATTTRIVASGRRSRGQVVCPLLDTHLRVMGEIAFEYALVKPLADVKLEIGGPVQTYWKATNTTHPQHSTSSVLSSPLSTLSMGSGGGANRGSFLLPPPSSSSTTMGGGPAGTGLTSLGTPAMPSVPSAFLGGGSQSNSPVFSLGAHSSTNHIISTGRPHPDPVAAPTTAVTYPASFSTSFVTRPKPTRKIRSGSVTPQPLHSTALPASQTPPTGGHGTTADPSVMAFVTASSLADEHVLLQVQVTRDLVPVVFAAPKITVIEGLQFGVAAMTAQQFVRLGAQKLGLFMTGDSGQGWSPADRLGRACLDPDGNTVAKDDGKDGAGTDRPTTTESWYRALHHAYLTLEEALALLPVGLGVCIEVKYPCSPSSGDLLPIAAATSLLTTPIDNTAARDGTGRGPPMGQRRSGNRRVSCSWTDLPDINDLVDAILKVVYQPPSVTDNTTMTTAGPASRNILFTSFHPDVCTALNWKQPNFPVFFATHCGAAPLFATEAASSLCPSPPPPTRVEEDRLVEATLPYALPRKKPKSVATTTPAGNDAKDTAAMDWTTTDAVDDGDYEGHPLRKTPGKSPDLTIATATGGTEPRPSVENAGDETRPDANRCFLPIDGLSNPVSIKEAIKFARRNHLLGLLCNAYLPVQVPSLIRTIKSSGLILATFGAPNDRPENLALQKHYGVDAILVRGVFHYHGGVGGAGGAGILSSAAPGI
ncbi:phosphate system positive regulatory protein pho81 [Tieghemiomyces parasiticus]|uniref:Phosphate system positive regulatory protein pho81 n=1 Tax=Tieghemiomyces parasiticus TaxID=78921 RepID=A0A9W8ACT2_9FUNG|nr:phosphate system positive regulatory protein pho81 [Tieghemiomyces parasiticus]